MCSFCRGMIAEFVDDCLDVKKATLRWLFYNRYFCKYLQRNDYLPLTAL